MKKVILLNLVFLLLFVNLVFGEKDSVKKKGEVLYKSGNLYFEKRDYYKAISQFENALIKDYVDNEIYYKLSICYKEVKKYIKSMDCIARAIALLENVVDKKNLNG